MIRFKFLLYILLFPFIFNAQTDTTGSVIQVSLLPPLSSNGVNNAGSVNRLSINIIAGYAGGVKGAEFGGFANILKYNMEGLQLSGFTNVVGHSVNGIQAAGFVNVNGTNVQGIQLSGFANVNGDSLKGMQLAGFVNVNGVSMNGLQGAGFVNWNGGNSVGYQSAGFCNVVNGSLHGAQFAGFNNTVKGNIKALQLSGFSNVVAGDMHGLQGAGFANVVAGDIQGMQMSGFINVGKRLSGVQLGFINYCDSVKTGSPFGFLSIVKHGYHKPEIFTNESFQGGIQYKTGTNVFYNIFSFAVHHTASRTYYAWGYGVGTKLKLLNRSAINLDLSSHHINSGNTWTTHLNMLNKLSVTYSYGIFRNLTLFAGPSFNVFVSKNQGQSDFQSAPSIIPSLRFYDEILDDTRLILYPGFQAGLRF